MELKEVLSELEQGRAVVIPVESSNISTISYNPFTRNLTILFKRGDMYKYDNVDIETALKMVLSKSIGSYFAKNIVNKYNFTRLNKNGSVMYLG